MSIQHIRTSQNLVQNRSPYERAILINPKLQPKPKLACLSESTRTGTKGRKVDLYV